ncbi:sigma-B regulation protein RsbU (phosphoserine phosphatase) [Mariprofundus ferrinatatus]|uniref:Sigma-B regulation protein RsbU (Phosphoserine phosphatase) n=1 Tax=Mariprofundus ferrinatatus TaxID=1921087 RepID=A0A2K8L144_9PROT|nr:GAF domain-containing SpoIIE family protein phosphatase [Mariprofundus ferrinatatus]ATX80963.1 sigma-B regulation protein RsbU (phosphoserine phosphatase) [Mariprofundus ferrinatatus]
MNSESEKIEHLRRDNDRLRTALKINQLIAGELKLGPLLKQIMEITQSLMQAESCSLFLYDEQSGELVFHACSGEKEDQLREICRLPRGSGIAGWVAENLQTQRLADVYTDPRFNAEFDRETGFTTRNMICSPLIAHGKLIGVSQVINRTGGDFSDDDEQLMESLVQMVAVAIDNARTHERVVQQQLLQHDLELAKSIQESFLPGEPPEVDGYQVAFHMSTAFEVGGDFYDAAQLPDGRMAYLIGDISGKGVSAAMIMSTVLSDIRMELTHGGTAAEILNRLNITLCNKAKNGMFVSLILMLLDPETGVIEIANAGHLPPVHILSQRIWQHNEASGPPAGIILDASYDVDRLTLEPGEMVLLYTDGITEARNEHHIMLGEGRLLAWLNECPDTAESCMSFLIERIRAYTEGAAQSDDITLLILGRSR